MHIEHALIRGCKRFHLSRIRELDMEFPKAVTVICGESGRGKSSLLQELCPLPAVRTTYERDGLKELHIRHEGHEYVLLSDFTNRVSPHSFRRDGVELNQGHTTDVQEELVIKHFHLTPAIRNLIYNKTEVCALTKAERRNLFLSINPMDLRLVLAAHKASQGRFKDAKAQLQLLYSRKADLESRMLPADIVAQHQHTQDELNRQLNDIDKVIYALDQHVRTLRERFSEDLDYRRVCTDNNQPLIPTRDILTHCRTILCKARDYTSVVRGDGFNSAKAELQATQRSLDAEMQGLKANIENLTKEINEYQQHLDNANNTPVSSLEHDLAELDKAIAAYGDLPDNPIPQAYWDRYSSGLNHIQEILFIFRDVEVKMIAPEQLSQKFDEFRRLEQQTQSLTNETSQLETVVQEQATELEQHRTKAGIPEGCTFSMCGLRRIFTQRLAAVQERYQANQTKLTKLRQDLKSCTDKCAALAKFLEPYQRTQLLDRYYELLSLLNRGYYAIHDWNQELVERLNHQPLLVYKELEQRLSDARLWYAREEQRQRRKVLSAKLDTLLKSSGASLEFLQRKVTEKQTQIQENLKKYEDLERRHQAVATQYNLYLEYTLAADEISRFQQIFDRGERALIVEKTLAYWQKVENEFVQAKRYISEDLRKLDTIVRDQEIIRKTYEDEIMKNIAMIEKDRDIYAQLEMALSPNTGIPHKSMVRYLNALIHNVNSFLGQVWSYPMKIRSFDPNSPLDYGLRIDISGTPIADLNQLSEGQSEVTNLMWVLTILLQLKLLNNIPLYADEVGRAFDANHRMRMLNFLNSLVDNRYIDQLFLVSHYTEFINGFTDADIIYFGDNTGELPQGTNNHVRFVYE